VFGNIFFVDKKKEKIKMCPGAKMDNKQRKKGREAHIVAKLKIY
jgi:hypothetical protein